MNINNYNFNDFLIIISGPTASGKTALSEKLAEFLPVEIINADIGQFYKPFSIGTAKPNWKTKTVPHHLFDILDEPKNLSVVQYKKILSRSIQDVWRNKKIPVIVGGSLFYLKSLFFPPIELVEKDIVKKEPIKIDNSWEFLNKIDPKRASKLHPNDSYRISRALDIWKKTGIKPSDLNPDFAPFFNSIFIYIDLDKEILAERINERTGIMLQDGWIKEVENFINTPWELFFDKKGLIGYKEIADWLYNNKNFSIDELADIIALQTRQYSKRQKTFWKSFKKQLEVYKKNSDKNLLIKELNTLDIESFNIFIDSLKEEIKIFVADN